MSTHEPTFPKPKDSQSKMLRWALILTAVNVVIVIVAGIVSLPKVINTQVVTGKVQSGVDLQGCRSLYNADVVTAQTNALVVVLAGLKATATKDDGGLQDLITPDPDTNITPYDTTVGDIYSARDAYKQAIDMSNTNPEKFMKKCKAKQEVKEASPARPIPSSTITTTTEPGD